MFAFLNDCPFSLIKTDEGHIYLQVSVGPALKRVGVYDPDVVFKESSAKAMNFEIEMTRKVVNGRTAIVTTLKKGSTKTIGYRVEEIPVSDTITVTVSDYGEEFIYSIEPKPVKVNGFVVCGKWESDHSRLEISQLSGIGSCPWTIRDEKKEGE